METCTSKRKLMISQPMRGRTQEEIEKERDKIKEELEKHGHEVINTIFTEEAPKDIDIAIYYLSKSIESIGKVDGIVFAKGWENARGCRVEHQVAHEYGKIIFYDK